MMFIYAKLHTEGGKYLATVRIPPHKPEVLIWQENQYAARRTFIYKNEKYVEAKASLVCNEKGYPDLCAKAVPDEKLPPNTPTV